ncbi:SURF1 family protein [Meridianimarinicoccus aquatilis]|uniref:SURF1-like protein n=1 Tax=Meridianimarinicoccus aquatilis TaxID=2552766 RepID=A0A4R6B2Z6_9RHOB|nr:SURF1 family protein [Fluviibacterium aquatile]TDL91147.1 SURF1 family protein [Fluviibacterium aquatile]
MRNLLPILFGIAGTVFLVSLGVWQMQRLEWKQGILAEMDAHMTATPVAIPANPDPVGDAFLPVRATGAIGAREILVQSSLKSIGPGYRVLAPFTFEDRTILIDRGFIRSTGRDTMRPAVEDVTLIGNLHWPDEIDGFTPDPEGALWFARDVPVIAAELGTEPLLLVVRQTSEDPRAVTPLPVDTAGIPNNHLQYAVTWFLLAIVWAGMTAFFVAQQRRNRESQST